MPTPSGRPVRVFISHSHDDNAACQPLLATLAALGVDYWFDTERLDAGRRLSPRIQSAIAERNYFIRVCSSNVQRKPYWVDLETDAFRALQSDASEAGRPNERVLIPFILDSGYTVQPFERAVLYIDAARTPVTVWTQKLRSALGLDAPATQAPTLPVPIQPPPTITPPTIPMATAPEATIPPEPPASGSSVVAVRAWLWTYCIVSPLAFYLSLLGIFGALVVPRAAETGGWLQTYVATMGPLLGLAPLAVVLVFSIHARQNRWLTTILFWGLLLFLVAAVSDSSIVSQITADSLSFGADFAPGELQTISLLLLPMFVVPVLYSFWGMSASRNRPDTFVCLIASWLVSVALLFVLLSVSVANAAGAMSTPRPYTAPFASGAAILGGIPLILALALTLVEQHYRSFLGVGVSSLIVIFTPLLFGQAISSSLGIPASSLIALASPLVPLIYFTVRIIQRQRTVSVSR